MSRTPHDPCPSRVRTPHESTPLTTRVPHDPRPSRPAPVTSKTPGDGDGGALAGGKSRLGAGLQVERRRTPGLETVPSRCVCTPRLRAIAPLGEVGDGPHGLHPQSPHCTQSTTSRPSRRDFSSHHTIVFGSQVAVVVSSPLAVTFLRTVSRVLDRRAVYPSYRPSPPHETRPGSDPREHFRTHIAPHPSPNRPTW